MNMQAEEKKLPPAKNRLEGVLRQFAEEKKPALVTYLMAADPDKKTSLEVMQAMASAGSDVIELGMPFSDPMADGPIIQEAANRSLSQGTTIKTVLEQLYDFRQKNDETPIVLMGYYNPILKYGVKEFCNDAKLAGADGMIIVDLPPEEDEQMFAEAEKQGLSFIRLIAPTSDEERIERITSKARGFVYYISLTGTTGTKSVNPSTVLPAIRSIRQHTDLPVAVGFGVKTPEQAQEIGKFADAVVIGSSIVNIIGENAEAGTKDKMIDEVYQFINAVSKSLKATKKLY